MTCIIRLVIERDEKDTADNLCDYLEKIEKETQKWGYEVLSYSHKLEDQPS